MRNTTEPVDDGLPNVMEVEVASPRTLLDLNDAWSELKKEPLSVKESEERKDAGHISAPVNGGDRHERMRRSRSFADWRTHTIDMLRRDPQERRLVMRDIRSSARMAEVSITSSEVRLLVTTLWSSVGVNSEDIVPLLAYVSRGVSSRELQTIVEERLGPNPAGKLHYSKFADCVYELAKNGTRFHWDAKFTASERRFAYITSTVPRGMRRRLRKRVQFLAALFLAVDTQRLGKVSILDLHAGLVSVGEYITVDDLFQSLIDTNETELENLEAADFSLFLRLIGYIDGRSDRRLAARLATRTLTAPISIKTLSQLVRLFVALDTEKTGFVSCIRLPQRIIDTTRTPGMDVQYLFSLACEIANSYMRDSDHYDFAELLECAIEFSKHFRLARAKRRDWISSACKDDYLRPPGTIQWAALIDKLPINNKARVQDYMTALAALSDRHLRRTTRDGSNIFHHLAHFGDDVACKLTLSRENLRSLVIQRNRAGIHPAALAIVRQNFDCAAVLRPWIEYVLDSQAYGRKRQKLLEIRQRQLDTGGSGQGAHRTNEKNQRHLNVQRPWVEPGGVSKASLDKLAWQAH